jgi:hypothetical protein
MGFLFWRFGKCISAFQADENLFKIAGALPRPLLLQAISLKKLSSDSFWFFRYEYWGFKLMSPRAKSRGRSSRIETKKKVPTPLLVIFIFAGKQCYA